MSTIAVSGSVARPQPHAEGTKAGKGRYAKVGLATVVAATLANVLVYFAGDAVVGYDPDFLVLSNVSGAAIFTLAAAVGAVLLYGALLRWTRNPVRIFHAVAAVVFVATTVPDFTYIPGVEGASTGQAAVLVLMHVVAAAVIVPMRHAGLGEGDGRAV
jgi:hypothetical protein